MDSQVPPAPPTPTVTKPFPRQARSRARASAEDAAWLRESGSLLEEAIESSDGIDPIDPKAHRLLREIFGPSPDAWRVSALVALMFHGRFTGRIPSLSLPDNEPEIPELYELPSDARKMLLKVKRLLEHARAGELAVGGRRVSKQRVRRYSDLAELLKRITDEPQKRSRPSDEWHAKARLYARMLEDACHMVGVALPTRNSTKSPLVTAVQGLLLLEGLTCTPDAVRRILGRIRG